MRQSMPLQVGFIEPGQHEQERWLAKRAGEGTDGVGTLPSGPGLSQLDAAMKPGPYGPFPYSPIIRRPRLEWPGGAHVALWVVPNIEFFSLETRPGGLGPGKIPDIPIWAMRDYGNRVGVFRMMEVLDRYGVRATVALNSDICVHHPEIIEEGEKRRWEWMGHNQSNSRRLNEVPAEEEPQIIRDTLDTIARASGRRPVGWLGAGLQETWNTLDLLAEAGCEYVADWGPNDDQPYTMALSAGQNNRVTAVQL